MRQNIWSETAPSPFMFTVGTPWHSQEPAPPLQALTVFSNKSKQWGAHISYYFFSLARCACHCVDRARGGGEITELCSGLAITFVHTGGTPDTPATFGYFLFSGTVLDFHLISLQTSSSTPRSDKHLAVSFLVNWKYVIFRDIDTPPLYISSKVWTWQSKPAIRTGDWKGLLFAVKIVWA